MKRILATASILGAYHWKYKIKLWCMDLPDVFCGQRAGNPSCDALLRLMADCQGKWKIEKVSKRWWNSNYVRKSEGWQSWLKLFRNRWWSWLILYRPINERRAIARARRITRLKSTKRAINRPPKIDFCYIFVCGKKLYLRTAQPLSSPPPFCRAYYCHFGLKLCGRTIVQSA